jgi:hypothetical protein
MDLEVPHPQRQEPYQQDKAELQQQQPALHLTKLVLLSELRHENP